MANMKIFSTHDLTYLKAVFSTMKLLPSLHIGSRNYNYFFPRKANLIMFITNRCNSRCIICNHWEQPVKQDLPLKLIEKIIRSKVLNKNGILIEGGETILHPDIDDILCVFNKEEINNFVLLTNGILTDKLAKLVEKHKIPGVSISLDGVKSTYKSLRGIDGYDDVLKSIDLLKDKTNLTVCFTATPWNTFEDYIHVQKICQQKNIRLLFNIYCRMEYSGKPHEDVMIDERYERSSDNPYVKFYNNWVEGKIQSPCLAMRYLTNVLPNGNVVLCQSKWNLVLGNLHEKSLDEIWNSEKTKSIQRTNKFCNDCWISSHRHFDAKLGVLLKRIIPFNLSAKIINAL